ncbi:hypothetical protein BH24ACT18_BH24ACT18_17680 [soil metagenome]|jgi:hypothetical protein
MILLMDDRSESLTAWEDLASTLGGSFAARARGVVTPELILLTPAGEPFGRLTAGEAGRTHLQAGDLAAWIEPRADATYGMTTGDENILTAEPTDSPAFLMLRSGERRYEARISLLRNRATATASVGNETVRLSGGLTNRRYRATFDPRDPASLPIAVFLLHHTVTLRSKAYRTGS